MSQQITAKGIVLSRVNYGEADRILTLVTPDHGKLRLMAKGVRRSKSKLAGGIELFSVSQITFIRGRGDIGTLTSSRLSAHFGHIVQDYERLQFGYEAIKQINRATESVSEPDFYELLLTTFQSLDEPKIHLEIIEIWFRLQLAILLGAGLNLTNDKAGQKLSADCRYDYDGEARALTALPEGRFTTDHIKLLRLLSRYSPQVAAQVKNASQLTADCLWLARVASA